MEIISSEISKASGRTSEVGHLGKPKKRGDRTQESGVLIDRPRESDGHIQRQYRGTSDHSASKREKHNGSAVTRADKCQIYAQDGHASETDCHILDARV